MRSVRVTGVHMPNRTAKFVSAIFASFLAGAPLATVSYGAADPTDECLSGPKGQTPQGSHWYYRVEHTSKRHCWYLADQREPLSQTAAPNSLCLAQAASADAKAAMQTSVTDAHAELPASSPAELTNRNAEIAPPTSADAVRSEDHHSEATPGMSSQRSLVASRWPEPSGTAPSVNPLPSRPDPGSNRESGRTHNQPTPVLTAGQFAVADMSSESPPYSAQMPLAAHAWRVWHWRASWEASFSNSAVRESFDRAQIGERRAPIWERRQDDDRIMLSRHPAAADFAHGIERPADPSERIAEFFARISGRAPA